jgi:hypothetical protein
MDIFTSFQCDTPEGKADLLRQSAQRNGDVWANQRCRHQKRIFTLTLAGVAEKCGEASLVRAKASAANAVSHQGAACVTQAKIEKGLEGLESRSS